MINLKWLLFAWGILLILTPSIQNLKASYPFKPRHPGPYFEVVILLSRLSRSPGVSGLCKPVGFVLFHFRRSSGSQELFEGFFSWSFSAEIPSWAKWYILRFLREFQQQYYWQLNLELEFLILWIWWLCWAGFSAASDRAARAAFGGPAIFKITG